jgi:hypothetical protein
MKLEKAWIIAVTCAMLAGLLVLAIAECAG